MKTPSLFIGGLLLFWGIETENVLIAVVLALLFEGSHLIGTRYNLEEEDFVKISDLTSLLFLGAVALVLLNYEALGFLRITAGWLPLILSPLMLAQLYSTSDTIVIGTRLGRGKRTYTHKPIDFQPYYFMVCLFAGATANSRSIWFFPVAGLFIAWFLYSNRGRSSSIYVFGALIAAASSLGYGGSLAMESGHRYVLRETFGFMHRYYREQRSDPNKTHVNFGDTGRMKLSGDIIMRVDSPSRPPELMKEAVYSIFIKGSWFGNQSDFEFLSPVEEGSWDLITPAPPDGRKVAVELDLPREKGLLPYPHGGSRLTSDTIFELEQNRDGTVKIIDGAPIVRYELFYHPGLERMEGHPQARNLEIPDNERDTLQKVVDGLGLEHAAPSEKVLALQKFFNSGFSYSLRLLGRGGEETALANFLLRERSGFCEYYATATTLLLRILDIPSRYAIGYAVQEKSILEGKYLVRKRHAHAWAEAYVDEKWEVVDTTPADWLARDAEGASVFEAIRDLFSFVRHKYKVFRIGSGTDYTLSLSIIVVLLTGFLVIRIYRRLKIEAAGRGEEEKTRRLFTVMDSPFTPILAMLEQTEKGRNKEELLIDWAGRTGIWADFDRDDFAALYLLHLRLRYDPEGISAEERKLLRQGAEKYLRTDTTPLSS